MSPYRIVGKTVFNKKTGKKVGTTKGRVADYLAALYAHEGINKKKK